jgi:hypothetical protein
MWFRVFGTDERQPEPAAMLEHLHANGFDVRADYRGDDQGWFEVELTLGAGIPVRLACYRAKEEGLRDDLNGWAAWIEAQENTPNQGRLMQHVIRTTQFFTFELAPDHPQAGSLYLAGVALCRFLSHRTAGVYQVDGQGFFEADGTLLLQEH